MKVGDDDGSGYKRDGVESKVTAAEKVAVKHMDHYDQLVQSCQEAKHSIIMICLEWSGFQMGLEEKQLTKKTGKQIGRDSHD